MKKNVSTNKVSKYEAETNRLLVATVVAIMALFGLLLVHRGMGNAATIMGARSVMAVCAIILCIFAAIFAVYALVKKRDWTLLEYPLFALLYAFGLYCIRGVWFVNSLHSLYAMVPVCVLYLAVSFVFHTLRAKRK